MKKVFFAVLFFISFEIIFSQSHISTQAHQSPVTALATLEGTIGEDKTVFSSGLDGFLIKWSEDGLGEHYQISDLAIQMIARSPKGNDIAVYTTDGASTNMVSVWNFNTLTRKYAYRFSDPITSLSYSAKGNYVICGTASVKGTYFLNTNTGSITSKKLKESSGAVNMVVTSDTENTAVMYSPIGTLTYYNLRTGQRKARFNTEPNLTQTGMFNNSVFFAGYNNGTLYVVQATTGKTIGKYSINSENPILIISNNKQDLYYILNENRQFKLFKVQNDRNKSVIQPQLIRTFSGLGQNEKIVSATITENKIYAGTNLGNIFTFDNAESERVDSLLPITDNMYDHIYDVDVIEENFYFLTPNAIFLSSYDNGIVDKKGINPGYTNLITYSQGVILWSKETKRPVQYLDLSSGKLSTLFTPKNNIQNIRLFNNSLIYIEGNSIVNRFNITNANSEQLYIGTGIQDAVLYNETDLYIAKTSATNPQVPFLYVNTKTKETVPLSLKGNVAYSLSFDNSVDSPEIYGILIKTDSSNKLQTTVFAWEPNSKVSRTILSISEEDGDAFSYLSWPTLYTNIGKSQVKSYNLIGKKSFEYKRSASLPLKVSKNKTRIVVLNRDGSISWYNQNTSNVIADWYLTTDGQWFEFSGN